MAVKSRLGQNFLVNKHYVNKILTSAELAEKDRVFEIGPGKGALTAEIAHYVSEVIAVEIDEKLVKELGKKLSGQENVNIVCSDILDFNFNTLKGGKYKVISNLPYYISSPVARLLIKNRHLFSDIYLLLQKEVAERIIAPVKSAKGYLSHYVNFYSNVVKLFNIPAQAFSPVPAVESTFIRIRPDLEPKFCLSSEEGFFEFIKVCFSHRRKMLYSNLKKSHIRGVYTEELMEQLEINTKARAEDLSLAELVALYKGAVNGID